MRISKWYRLDTDPPGEALIAEVRDVDGEVAGWVVADSVGDGSWKVGFSTNLGDAVDVVDVHTLADGLESRDAAQVSVELWAHKLAAAEQVAA